jgi:tetratricopeptide (TPR) repeat protein
LRQNSNEEAARLLEAAVVAAEPLGDEGYETRVLSLMQLGFLLPGLGRLGDAREVLDHVITLCEGRGDRIHMAVSLMHRAFLWGYLDDRVRLIADLDRTVELARALGQPSLELAGHFNAGEGLLLMGDAAAAEPRVRRAAALDRQLHGDLGQPLVALLWARMLLYRGDDHDAAAVVADLRARRDASMAPPEEVFCAMLELVTRDASDGEWDELEARAERVSLCQERIEVVEARAVAAARLGRIEEARRALRRAIALASRIPNVMRARLGKRAAELNRGAEDEGSAALTGA